MKNQINIFIIIRTFKLLNTIISAIPKAFHRIIKKVLIKLDEEVDFCSLFFGYFIFFSLPVYVKQPAKMI